MIERDVFYNAVRRSLFHGAMSPDQVTGTNALLDEWESRDYADPRGLGYILATGYWETGQKMMPVAEVGRGHGHGYGLIDKSTGFAYYGRGVPQLTWRSNYQKMSDLIGTDLVFHPDRMLDPGISARVTVMGMVAGSFTGRKLADYFSVRVNDPVGARAIINGADQAAAIAATHRLFMVALTLSQTAADPGLRAPIA